MRKHTNVSIKLLYKKYVLLFSKCWPYWYTTESETVKHVTTFSLKYMKSHLVYPDPMNGLRELQNRRENSCWTIQRQPEMFEKL